MNGSLSASLLLTAILLAAPAAAAPAPWGGCAPCRLAQERCAANCFVFEGKAAFGPCLTGCANAAATCTLCDEEVTLRSEDFVPAWDALAGGACHSTTPCGSTYGSCAGWSLYSACGEPRCRGLQPGCGTDCEPGFPCTGQGLVQQVERYRVCFNAQGQSCTEYQFTVISAGCGC